jgi:hypothetical protein
LNSKNQLYNANSNALVFANRVDTNTSDSSYLDTNVNKAYANINKLILKEFILTALEQRIHKNNILVIAKIVKKTTRKA